MTLHRSPTPAVTRIVAVAAVVMLSLSGCSDAKKALGWTKTPPDEFSVVSRAPLSVPPQFQLRPPEPGAVRPQEGTAREQARGALLGSRAVEVGSRSPGEVALLQMAGADRAMPDVRSVVNRELAALADADKTFTDRLVFWRAPEQPGTLVDPSKEAQRLQTNRALGRAATEGETPLIKRRKKGLLEDLF